MIKTIVTVRLFNKKQARGSREYFQTVSNSKVSGLGYRQFPRDDCNTWNVYIQVSLRG